MVHYTVTQDNLSELCEAWLEARRQENEAQKRRRELEMQIRMLVGASRSLENSRVVVVGPYSIEITTKARQEVDTDRLFEIARENGLTKHLPALFRWYAEINKEAWQRADERVTEAFEPAIKMRFNQHSFNINKSPETQETSAAR